MVDGGFVAFVDALVASQGCVDTKVLVGHDESRWAEYCSNHHRSNSNNHNNISGGNVNEEIGSHHHSRDKISAVDHSLGRGGDGDDRSNPRTSFSSSSSTVSSSFHSSSSSKALSSGGQSTGTAVGFTVAADSSNVSGMINVKKARDSLSVQQQMKMALEVTNTINTIGIIDSCMLIYFLMCIRRQTIDIVQFTFSNLSLVLSNH